MLSSTKFIAPAEATKGQEATVWFGNGSGQGGNIAAVSAEYVTLRTPVNTQTFPVEKFTSGEYRLEVNDPMPASACIEHGPECSGHVDLRMSLSGTGTPIPRCEGHWHKRLDLQGQLNRRYPVHAPADFDPLYAGESWDEDY